VVATSSSSANSFWYFFRNLSAFASMSGFSFGAEPWATAFATKTTTATVKTHLFIGLLLANLR